jgi:hypothetical protein
MIAGNIYTFFKYASILSVLIPFIACCIRFKTLNKELRVLFLYIFLSLITELIVVIFRSRWPHTYLLYNCFTILELSLLSYIYLLRFEEKTARRIIRGLYFLFLGLVFILLVVIGGYDQRNTLLSTYEAALFIGISYAYFIKITKDASIPNLTQYYFAWINAGVLVYFCMAFLIFLFQAYIERRGFQTFNKLYLLNWIINITYNLFLATGVWKFKRI